MTVLKRMIPALAVTGALVLPMQAMAAKVVSEIQDIDKTAGTIMLDGGQLYRVPPQVAIFGQLEKGDRVHVWFDQGGEGQGVPRVTRISRADETTGPGETTGTAAADGQQASMSGDASSEEGWGDMAGGADATVDDIDRTSGTVVMSSGKLYRVPPQAANFENIKEGDKVRFWSKAEQGGSEIITRIVRVQDDGMPMREDYAAAMAEGSDSRTAGDRQTAMSSGSADGTVDDIDRTAGTVLMSDGKLYRVPARVANFENIEAGDKVWFWSEAEQGGSEIITRIVRVRDDGTPMDEDLAEKGSAPNVERDNEGRK